MANYGDVALNLSPQWSRKMERDKKYALWIVGHQDGLSDARLSKEPDKRHQFAWIDTRYQDELAINLSNGFVFVTKGEWGINDVIWQWNAESRCYNQGQLLMARPAALYFAQKAEMERELSGRVDTAGAEGDEIAERAGLKVDRVEDEPIRRRR